MVFTSILFLLVFLPVFFLLYFAVAPKYRNAVALVASLTFYMWGAPAFFWVLLTLLVGNFYVVKRMSLASTNDSIRRILLISSLVINLGVLAYFKYANFMVENVNALLEGLGVQPIKWLEVALPIGISFFTFQSITYTLDVYWKKHAPLDRLMDYLLYILLFPQLIAGPIIRFNTIADEIKDRRHNFTTDYKLSGFYIFTIGLAKKVLIANAVGSQVDSIFAQAENVSPYLSWIGIVAYSIQIYFDFSGYSDMAIGLGKVMGFNFPENFKSPYTSLSITEFWRRWHITLGAFMRDYLYIPLGGNRVGPGYRTYLNLIIVFFLSGLWHGASWNFVIWGVWHGLFLIIERAFLHAWLQKIPKLFSILYTYFIVLLGWVFFRAETLQDAMIYLQRMFGFGGNRAAEIELDVAFFTSLFIGLIFAFITLFKVGQKVERFFYYSLYSLRTHFWMSLGAVACTVLSVSYIASSDFNPFIYFRF